MSNRVFFTQVHGIFHDNYDGSSRQDIIRDLRLGEELVLVAEPDNKFDPGAVKICRRNGQQIGYWQSDGRMEANLASGWTYRVTVQEVYRLRKKGNGCKLQIEVLTMSRTTEERKRRKAEKMAATVKPLEPEPVKKNWFHRLFS